MNWKEVLADERKKRNVKFAIESRKRRKEREIVERNKGMYDHFSFAYLYHFIARIHQFPRFSHQLHISLHNI